MSALRAVLRVDQGMPFVGIVHAGRRGLRWRARWSARAHHIRWDGVVSCVAGRDQRLGVERHSHRLVLEGDSGMVEVMLRGPWGALALVELRDAIRAAAHLVVDEAVPGRFVRR